MPDRVNEDTAYQNAKMYSNPQNARLEFEAALKRQITAMLKDNTKLYEKFTEDPEFQQWLSGVIFAAAYKGTKDPSSSEN